MGANKITVVVTAQNGTATSSYSITITRAPSWVSSLSSLALNAGTLSPTFVSSTKSYTTNVATTVKSLRVTPKVMQPDATVTVNGTAVASGSASPAIPLSVGINTIIVVVTAQNGTATSTYKVKVTRAAADASANVLAAAFQSPENERQTITRAAAGGLNYLQVTIQNPAGSTVKRIVEVSPNLVDWYSGTRFTTTVADNAEILRVRDNTPLIPGTKRYIRVRIITP